MVTRSSRFLVSIMPVILSLLLQNLLAQPDTTILQTIVSGLRDGWSNEQQHYIPDEIIEIVIFGENLNQEIIGDIYLTDSGRCGDIEKLQKHKIPMIFDNTYIDSAAIIVKSKKPIPSDLRSILRLCFSTMDDNHIPPQTSWIHPEPEDSYFIPLPFLIGCFAITLFTSACFSGLNLAYSVLSLEQLHMLANKKSAEPDEKKKAQHAQRVLPFRKRSNWLIATFAIGNTIVNILSTLIAEEMFSKVQAKVILINTVPVIMTMLFGEILPQAICNKRALSVASNLRIVVILMMGIFCIVAWPLSRLLDCILGREPIRVYDLKQLSIILEEHGANKEIVGNVMKFPTLKIGKIMTRIQDAYLLSQNDILDMNRMIGILEKGYTRVPVYADLDRKKIVAVLNVKDLILADPNEKKRVQDVLKDINSIPIIAERKTSEIRFGSCEMPAQDVMNEMAHGQQHLMMVFRYDNKMYYVIGLITLEDIIEEFIGEIQDDDDAAFPTNRASFRRDQITFDWFRGGVDKKTGLSANGMLKLIQDILKECPVFVKLNFNVYAMRALVHVSEIEQIEKKIIIEKGSTMKCLYVVIYGEVAKDGVKVTDHRPVIGNALLEKLNDNLFSNSLSHNCDLDDIEITADSKISLLSARGMILKITLYDVFNIIKAMDFERAAEEVLNQFDHYIHAVAFMGAPQFGNFQPFPMHASMEEITQNIGAGGYNSPATAFKAKEAYEITAIGDTSQESHKEKKNSKPSKEKHKPPSMKDKPFSKEKLTSKEKLLKKPTAAAAKGKTVLLDPKLEQKTQLLEKGGNSNSKKSKMSQRKKKQKKSKSRTPPTAAPNATAVVDSEAENEDKTQKSTTKPLL